jgi:hypothetical protein
VLESSSETQLLDRQQLLSCIVFISFHIIKYFAFQLFFKYKTKKHDREVCLAHMEAFSYAWNNISGWELSHKLGCIVLKNLPCEVFPYFQPFVIHCTSIYLSTYRYNLILFISIYVPSLTFAIPAPRMWILYFDFRKVSLRMMALCETPKRY